MRRKIIAASLFVAATLALLFSGPFRHLLTAQAQTGPSVFINEIHYDNTGADTGEGVEIVELYNNTDGDIHVATTDGTAGWALAALSSDGTTVVPVVTIPAGEIIPARSHYLIANGPPPAAGPAGDASPLLVVAGGYSLGSYAAPDLTYTTDIPDGGGVALFRTADSSGFSDDTRLDAVGYNALTSAPSELFREGTPLQSPGANDGQYAFVRSLTTGRPQDTDNNAADFRFVSDTGGMYGDAQSTLGAPGPQGSDSPLQRNQIVKATLIDPQVPHSEAPNTVRKSCAPADPPAEECDPNRSADGTFSIRRRWTNRTGANVTALRFRLVDVTTLNSPGYSPGGTQADLRALTSSDVNGVVVTGGTVNVQGTTLEAPSSSSLGGGLNSTLVAGTVSLMDPLVPDESINLQFLLGVQQAGAYRLFVNVEAVSSPPTAAPARSKAGASQPKAGKSPTKP